MKISSRHHRAPLPPDRPTRRVTPHGSRRTACAAIATLALATSIAACSGGSSSSASSHGGKVTLTYGIWDKNQLPAAQKIIAAFHKTHPKISVKVAVTPTPTYWTKLQTSVTSGTAPDVFWMNLSNLQLYASGKALLPLTKQIKDAKIDMSQFAKAIADGYQYQGQKWCMPKDVDSVGLWYNKKLFQDAGVSLPTANWTWQDVITAATKITKHGGGVYGIAADDSDQVNYYNTIWQAGGQIISPNGKKSGYDSPAAIKGIQFWTNLINKDHASPSLKQMTDTPAEQMFESGKVAMFYGGSWEAVAFSQVPYLVKNANVTVMPQGKIRATESNGLANCISAKTDHPNEAWQFVRFLGSQQAADIQASTGAVIPAMTSEQQKWVAHYPQFNVQIFIDELKYSKGFPVSKNTTAWRTYNQGEWALAWAGTKTVPEVAKLVADRMNTALSKEK